MLKLQNISKYYSRKGAVALGLRKVNLTLGSGEFVAVVGESGSGKSTLLNVISGLDTYEDGEMYLNREETSYYSVEDWENYRRKYIGFIFQNYNLIESYTVLQNVESALILAGYDAKKRRARALEIIERVGMTAFKNSRASKLSGGQMQRTVIARALAKDSPIIAADEPTGNLDSATSKQIIDLLYEISKEKLVIIVTHNYGEVADFVTRKITLHDGEIVEDQQLKKEIQVEALPELDDHTTKVSLYEIALMAFRNITSTPMKTMLMFMVLLMLTLGSALVYGGMLNFKDESAINNQNIYFNNSSEHRIVLKKQDNSAFTNLELNTLANDPLVEEIIEGDIALDQTLQTEFPKTYSNEKVAISAIIMPRALIDENDLTAGRMPEAEDEIVVNTYAIRDGVLIEDVINKTFDYTFGLETYKLKIVGISENKKLNEIAYVHSKYYDLIAKIAMKEYKKFTYSMASFKNIEFTPRIYTGEIELAADEIVVNTSLAYFYSTLANIDVANMINEVKGKTVEVEVSNLYDKKEKEFQIARVMENESEEDEPRIYFSQETFDELIKENATYQVSVMVDSFTNGNRLSNELKSSNYKIFYPFGTLDKISYFVNVAIVIVYGIFLITFIGGFFFITYFILKNIMKSKKYDYVILRSIGATQSLISKVILFELLIISISTFIVTVLISFSGDFVTIKYITKALTKLFNYYRAIDYIYIFLIIISLAFLLNYRFNKKIFSDSVVATFKGEEGE